MKWNEFKQSFLSYKRPRIKVFLTYHIVNFIFDILESDHFLASMAQLFLNLTEKEVQVKRIQISFVSNVEYSDMKNTKYKND